MEQKKDEWKGYDQQEKNFLDLKKRFKSVEKQDIKRKNKHFFTSKNVKNANSLALLPFLKKNNVSFSKEKTNFLENSKIEVVLNIKLSLIELKKYRIHFFY